MSAPRLSKARPPAVDPSIIGNLRRMAQQSGQIAVFRRLINEFLEEAEEALLGMEGALQQLDYRQLQAHSHALKGSAAQIGAMGLSYLARDVEDAAKRDCDADARVPVGQALDELNRVRGELLEARELPAEPAA